VSTSRPPRPDFEPDPGPDPGPDLESVMQQRDSLRRLARGLVLDEHRAEDVVHDAWVAALEKPPEPRAPLAAWLASVVRNVASNVVRREAQRPAREAQAARPERIEPDEERDLELQELVVAHLRRLRQPYRTVLYLRYFKDLPPRDIARQRGVPLATVKTQLRRGLALLREELDRQHGGERSGWCLGLLGVAAPEVDPTAVALEVVRSARPADLAAAATTTPAVAVAGGSLSALVVALGAGLFGSSVASPVPDPLAASGVVSPVDAGTAASSGDARGARPGGRRVAVVPDEARAATERADAGIVGTVVGVDGRPIEGAHVATGRDLATTDVVLASTSFAFTRTFTAEASISNGSVFATTTDADGRFALPAGARHASSLSVSAPGWAELTHELAVGDARTLDVGRLELERGAVLVGRVVDERGRGIAGATLLPARDSFVGPFAGPLDAWLPARGPHVVRGVETGPDGGFRLDTLDPGRWSFVVSAPGFVPRTFEGRASRDAPTERELRLPRGAELAGRVVGAALPPSAGVRATLVDRDGEPFGPAARADVAADGTFRLQGCAAGSSYVLAPVDAGGRALGGEVTARAPAAGVELACDASASVALEIVDARTQRALPAGRVRWVTEPFGTWGQPWSDGRAELAARRTTVPAELVVSAPGHAPWSETVRLAPGERRALRIELEPVSTVTFGEVECCGRAAEGARVQCVSDPADGASSPGASLRWLAPRESTLGGGWTDARGRARVALPEDDTPARVRIEAPGHVVRELDLTPADRESEPFVVALEPAAVLELRVVDEGGRPIPGALVVLERPSASDTNPANVGERRVRTDAAGTARVRSLEPGVVHLRAGSTGGARAIELEAGGIRAVELTGRRSAELEGVVRVGTAPLEGATVRCAPLEADGAVVVGGTRADAAARTAGDGRFTVAGLEPGAYSVEIRHPDRAMPARFERTLEPGAVRLDFDLDVTRVAGRVVDEDGRPVAGALVRARAAARDSRSTHVVFRSRAMLARGGAVIRAEHDTAGVRTDADGRYELEGVASRVPIVVVAEAPGHAPRTSAPFELPRFGRRDDVELALSAAGTIVATVVADGRPVPGAILLARPAGEATDLRSATTDRDGGARFDDLAPGRWSVFGLSSLELGPGDASPGGTTVDVRAGRTERVELAP